MTHDEVDANGPSADQLREAERFLPGGGEMGTRVRAAAWGATRLGSIEAWPQSLRSALSICLGSRFPIVIYWGTDLLTFYNDAYAPILADKHPWALGRPCRDVWAEIWEVIGPQMEGVLRTGDATWSDDQLLVLRRHGYLEECYFSFSFSPIREERGAVGGVFTAVTENTQRVLAERRLQTLRDLAAGSAEAKSVEDACRAAAEILGRNPADIPFSLLYLLDHGRGTAYLVGASGLQRGTRGAPEAVSLDGDEQSAPWPFSEAVRRRDLVTVQGLEDRIGGLPETAWAERPDMAALQSIAAAGQEKPAALMIAGISPRRALDRDYRTFFELIAGHVASAIANAGAYAAERRRAEALAELDRAKTAFFSNVSHEFRTPLTLMLGPLDEALSDPASPARLRERLELMRRNGLRLQKLVNTLLDFSRIEAGRIEANYEPTDLPAFTAQLASMFESAVQRAGLRLVVDCPPAPEPAYVDRDMWEKIVMNLLSNAFKFTPQGEIHISVRATADAFALVVRDTGIGIPRQEMARLFERFHRVRHAEARTHEGTGIGLALVQELTRLHGGEVRAASNVGRGTEFSVRIARGTAHLPADRIQLGRDVSSTAVGARPFVEEALRWLPDGGASQEPRAAVEDSSGARSPSSVPCLGARIVIADDNADMRDYLRGILGQYWSVEMATDGTTALRMVRQNPPDLVVTDVMMPGLGGFELLRALRDDDRANAAPVILLSARAGDEAAAEALEAGADAYLVKPFAARELVAYVGGLLQLRQLRLRAQAELAAANANLKEADRRKDEFLAMLAHELRNPLSAMRNAVVTASLDPERRERALEIARRQTEQLGRLIDDLLDVARITRGRIALRKERASLAEILERAIENTRSLIESRGLRLEVSSALPSADMEADATRMEQVFVNLLSNAAKFTDSGGRIGLVAERSRDTATIRIRDTGIGIAPQMLSRIWDLFEQGDRSLDRSQGGLGIGLTIARRLVELHGGHIEARSDGIGQGAEFAVVLPLLPAADQPTRSKTFAPPIAPSHTRVLLVEDNPDAAESLTMLLELVGHRVRTVHDAIAALDAARAEVPDVMLVDIGLPGMDGYELARRVRRDPALSRVVLVALTGYGRTEDKENATASGFDHHLVKPVDLDALNGLVARLAKPHRSTAAASAGKTPTVH